MRLDYILLKPPTPVGQVRNNLQIANLESWSPMSANEKHFSVIEISKMWKLCPDTIRAIFKDASGVIRIDRPKTRKKRAYLSLRIPESVMQRVHHNLTKQAA